MRWATSARSRSRRGPRQSSRTSRRRELPRPRASGVEDRPTLVDETRSGWRRTRRGDAVSRPHILGALAGQREETRRGGDGLDRHTRRRARRAAVAVSHRCEDRCGGQRVRDPRRYVGARAGRLPSRRMARVDGKLHDRGARSCRRGPPASSSQEDPEPCFDSDRVEDSSPRGPRSGSAFFHRPCGDSHLIQGVVDVELGEAEIPRSETEQERCRGERSRMSPHRRFPRRTPPR